MLVSVKQLKKETNQTPRGFDFFDEKASLATADDPVLATEEKAIISTITKDNILGNAINLEKRKEMLLAKGIEPVDFAYERAIGKNDSLYSNFIELIALTKRKVGRICIIENGKKSGYATGFMVSKDLLLTNWHVFSEAAMAKDSEVHFFYEYDIHGRPKSPVIFKFNTTHFYANETLDYCFVGVQPVDVSGTFSLSTISYLYLDKALGKIGDVNIERLNIIHHPLGDYKQLSIRENLFVGIDDTKIYYETDTAQGSSGSPVFNDQWQVVGLHHKSIAKMSADGSNYLDIKGKVIPSVDGKIDITRVVWLKNEGMRISVVLNHLKEKNPPSPVIDAIGVAPPPENLNFTTNYLATELLNPPIPSTMAATSNDTITIHIPVTALSNDNAIDISVSTKKISSTALPVSAAIAPASNSEMLLELAKIDKEAAVDFSKCTGYDPDFLGITIPFPKPKRALKKEIALLQDKSMELKYFKYSVIFNALKKMPLLSAINVEGDASLRLDNSTRDDDWLRDRRIDIECQLEDKFYAYSKFDKGHMSRFEDANWDTTEAQALQNSIYTCFYTNACPQVPSLNRTGLWGKLEKAVLEKGVKKEAGKQGRMTVFNGPIFNSEKDRIFKGLRIPMAFFKIILWLNDADALKATAFKLTQEDLVGEVQFDESMRLDLEAIDINTLVAFKSYQCSIKSLSTATGIDFKGIEKYDTYVPTAGGNESLLVSQESMVL